MVSEAALEEMRADPEAAYAGFAKGLADHLALPAERVVVTGTVPDLFGAAPGARRLSGASSLEVVDKLIFSICADVMICSAHSALCVARQALSNESLVAKIGDDKAENEFSISRRGDVH